jgi:biotin transport system substrate-specific component
MCRTALMAALICIFGPLTVPVGPVPLSMATLAVYLAGALLGAKQGAAAVGLYLLMGASGLPVFSGFTAGVQRLAGPTGGYLLGYVLCAAVVGILCGKWGLPAAMIAGTMVCYAVGTAWFMVQTGVNPAGALTTCVIPFLPGDAMKIIAARTIIKDMQKRWIP